MSTKLEQAARQALGALVRAEAMYGQPNADIQTALREALKENEMAKIEGINTLDRFTPAEQAEPMTDTELINTNCRYTTPLMAEQAEQEPVGYFAYDEEHDIWEELTGPNAPGATPLYAAPFRTKDLTDDEIEECVHIADSECTEDACMPWFIEFARAVIAAYKEKNK